VERDYNQRKLRQIIVAMRDFVIQQKMLKIEEIMGRQSNDFV
jgi:hypothetical protein